MKMGGAHGARRCECAARGALREGESRGALCLSLELTRRFVLARRGPQQQLRKILQHDAVGAYPYISIH